MDRVRRYLIALAAIVLLLGALFFVANYHKPKPTNTKTQTASNNTGKSNNGPVIAMSLARSPSFVTPRDMNGYYKDTGFDVAVNDYTMQDESGCNLQFGVVGAADLPGDTLTDVAMYHFRATDADNATIISQTDGENLVLSDNHKNQRYIMQTIDMTYLRDNVTYMGSDSIAFLPGNKRAFVRRYCANMGGSQVTDWKKINEKAKEIQIQTK